MPAVSTRKRADDSDRTKMLKEVMLSVSKYAATPGGSRKDESAQAAGQLIMKPPEDDEEDISKALKQKDIDPCEWGYLSIAQERRLKSTVRDDDFIAELDIGPEFSELLQYSGKLVRDLSNTLSGKRTLPERPHIDTTPADVVVISRHEAKDIMAGGATDHKRREQAASSWVQDNLKFKELDAIDNQIEEAGGGCEATQDKFEELRALFEPHHKYHPILSRLSDHALVDEDIWFDVVEAARYPMEDVPSDQETLKAKIGSGFSSFGSKSSQRLPAGALSTGKASSSQRLPGGSPKVQRISWAPGAANGAPQGRGAGKLSPGGRLSPQQSAPNLR